MLTIAFYFSTRHEGDQMLLFVSDFFLRLLCAAPLVFADGTFRSVSHIFTQLFTLSFMYHDKMLPAVYALVRRKTQSVYERVLGEVCRAAEDRGYQFQPVHLLTDFETRLVAAVAVQLPGTQQRGCFSTITGTAADLPDQQCTSLTFADGHGTSVSAC